MGSVRIRLSIMMFLEYALWGVWAVNLSVYLATLESFRENIGFKINMIFLTMAIANIVAPFVASQLADRYFSTERFLAFSHLVGGAFLIWAWWLTTPTFELLFWLMLGHCLLYAPTVALTNSLAFHHLPNGEKDFGSIRLWGTIGWIVAGVVFGFGWLALSSWAPGLAASLLRLPSVADCLIAAGALSILMAIYCLTLPHTPPVRKSENPLAFLTAIKLARYPSFAVMLVVAFLVSTELQFYYVLTPNFFHDEPGLSLSQNQLQKAASVNPSQATLLLRLLDTNNNKKISKAELDGSADREEELRDVLTVLKEQPSDADAIKKALEPGDSKKGDEKYFKFPAGRSAQDVAAYAVTAVDDTGSKKISAPQLEKFLNAVDPLTLNIAQAREKFKDDATEKGGLNLSEAAVGPVMTIGQFFEILILILLPFALAKLGFTLTIAIGIAAWALRYALFALGTPVWLVLASQGLHGFGFGFFFVGCMIYSDRIAPKDIRASAQGLIIFVSFGLGMLVSSLVAGPIADYFENDWHLIFLAPVTILVLCTIVFLIGFRPMPAVAEDDIGKKPVPPTDQDLIGATEEQKYR